MGCFSAPPVVTRLTVYRRLSVVRPRWASLNFSKLGHFEENEHYIEKLVKFGFNKKAKNELLYTEVKKGTIIIGAIYQEVLSAICFPNLIK